MKNIAIFASGSGTNAENLIEYFNGGDLAQVKLILSNKENAAVLQKARKRQIPIVTFTREAFYSNTDVLAMMKIHKIDVVVLAGFLWLMPTYIIQHYHGKIINIHPALLPKYGGKGMYGDNVHRAVINAGETETGITIHEVSEHYDEGKVILQAKCPVEKSDTPETLAVKIHQLEYKHLPLVVEQLIRKL